MPTPDNNIEIFDKGEVFPAASKVKSTSFDFFTLNGEPVPYLLESSFQEGQSTSIRIKKTILERRRAIVAGPHKSMISI
jgi:hypothetical protein